MNVDLKARLYCLSRDFPLCVSLDGVHCLVNESEFLAGDMTPVVRRCILASNDEKSIYQDPRLSDERVRFGQDAGCSGSRFTH